MVREEEGRNELASERSPGSTNSRSKRQRDASLIRSVSLTQTDVHHEQAGRQAGRQAAEAELATCSLLCSHTRARINLSVSCHVQRSHSLSPAAHRLQSLSTSRAREHSATVVPFLSPPATPKSQRLILSYTQTED